MILRCTILLSLAVALTAGVSAETLIQEYTFDRPEIHESRIGDDVYQRLVMPAAPNGGDAGSPALPSKGARILIPYGKEIENIEIIPGEKISLGNGYVIEPVGSPVSISTDPREYRLPVPNEDIYELSTPFPGYKYENIGVHSFRGYQFLVLRLHPVEYIPDTGELCYFHSLKVVITTRATQKSSPLFRGLAKDETEIAAKVDNPMAASSYEAAAKNGADNYDLLIFTVPGLEAAFQPLKDYHDSTGIATVIYTINDAGGYTPDDYRDFIREKYLNDGIDYVLIGDDDNLIPAGKMYIEAAVYDQGLIVDYRMPSDLFYACLDGPYDYDGDGRYGELTDGEGGGDVDLVAEVYVGRASVDIAADVTRFVNKTIQYLSSTDPYLHNVLVCSEDLLYPGGKHWGYMQMEELIDGASIHGYSTVGIPSDLYSVDRLYDYLWPGHNWPTDEVMDRIEGGVQIVNHLGHSIYDYTLKMTPIDVLVLNNTEPIFVYTQGCYAGGFDTLDIECMAEVFTVKTGKGAFAAIMNSRYGWVEAAAHPSTSDGASQRYNREFWDAVFNPEENKPELGRANQDSKEDNLYRISDGAMRWCYYQLNLFGDPTVPIKRFTGLAFDYPGGIPGTTLPGHETTFEVEVAGLYGGEPIPASGQLHYSLNGGEIQTTAMSETSANLYEATLPPIECGDTLAYYVSMEEQTSGRLYDPPPDSAHVLVPVMQTIIAFEDDFETDKDWDISGGLWARGIPTGNGGEKGWPDPAAGCNGPNVFGYNLSGDYENSMAERRLTSPAIDCSNLENVHLVFYRWLGVEHIPWDHVSLSVGLNVADWYVLWENPGLVQDSEWTEVRIDISEYAAYQPEVFLRWTMGPTNHIWHYCGWNIDDVRVVSYDCQGYYCGDANGDDLVNVGDAVYLINYVFREGPAPVPLESGDANADGSANVGDAVYLIAYIFKGGPNPKCP
jgi:hypothetical protein